MRTVTGIARPRVLGFRSWLPAALTSCPHTVSKAVHSPPRTVTAWCPLQLISHWSHLETQREVGSASTSSALLTGALQAFKLPGLVPLLQSQLTNRSLCPNGALVPFLLQPLLTLGLTNSLQLGCCLSFPTLTSWSPLGLNFLPGPEHLIQCPSRVAQGPSIPSLQPCLVAAPWGATLSSHT